MSLTRAEILEAVTASSGEVSEIDVPEWGGKVYAGRISIGEAERIGLFDPNTARGAGTMLALIVACLTDADGKRLLEPEDAELLASADFQLTIRLFKAIADANGLNEEDANEAAASFAEAQPSANSSS